MSAVLLVDLSALYAQAWFATVNDGDPTQARQLTLSTVMQACSKHDGDVVICLDSPRSVRKEIHPEYKANRPPKPPEFVRELVATQKALVEAGFLLAQADGYEADDVIATLTKRLRAQGKGVVIGSADKDLYQLLSHGVTMLSTRDGKTVDYLDCVEKFGVKPRQIADYLALVGDASDNVRGVRGIGPKRAAALLQKYDTIDGIYEALRTGEIRTSNAATPSMVTALQEAWETVGIARRLVALADDVAIEFIGEPEPATVAAPPEPTAKERRITMSEPAQKPTPQPAPKPVGRLALVKRGKVAAAYRILVYGGEGVGKSTLAAGAPNPIWLDIEGGSIHLDVARYPFHEGVLGYKPLYFNAVLDALTELATQPHEYRTVVIDTLDSLESLVWAHLVAEAKKRRPEIESIEDFGYGKGYVAAVDLWRDLLRRLDAVREKGINVMLLAHGLVKTFKNPEGEDFDRWQLRLNDKAANLFRDWCDVVGFLRHEMWAKKEKGALKAKGFDAGRRIMCTERCAAFDAKTRLPLAKEIEIGIADPFGPIAAAIASVANANPDELLAAIEAELVRINDAEVGAKARAAVEQRKGDAAALSRVLQALKAKAATVAEQPAA